MSVHRRYDAQSAAAIEGYWQDQWEANGTFEAANPVGDLAVGQSGSQSEGANNSASNSNAAEKPPFFLMDMFPYPSGAGLHVGHPLGYIATDVVGRFERMQGKNVLHTLGYDAFGLPAEQYAVQTGQHPRVTTEQNIMNMRRQLRRLGLAHDMRRSIETTDPDYVRWTQWIFLQIYNSWYDAEATAPDGSAGKARPIAELVEQFENGTRETGRGSWQTLSAAERADLLNEYRLAYVSESPVNWCPGLGTVLANEEVTAEGRSERGNFPVFQRALRQWNMRITAYSQRLLDDLQALDWPQKVKSMQQHWIGRSVGAQVRFAVQLTADTLADRVGEFEVFTTRPDTLFGATYAVLAPEHPLVSQLAEQVDQWPADVPANWTNGAATPREAIEGYRQAVDRKSELERQEFREKTGVFTGAYALNPVNGRALPIFIADYVLMGYGTGAIMAVPAEDDRDYDFASAYGLDIVRTVQPPADFEEGQAYTGEGVKINSANSEVDLNGMEVDAAIEKMTEWLVSAGHGSKQITYRLRDWLFSRQRYWGEPFPILYDEDGVAHAVPEHMLPVNLPEVPDYSPRTYDPQDADTQPEPPLARAEDWVHVTLDLGEGPKQYRRETNTMPNWAGSSYYELRYLDPNNAEALVDRQVEEYWMGPSAAKPHGGVDLYVGGVEHAVLHLLYARFWHKVLYDLGYLSSSEPFHRLFNQGYIQAYAFVDDRGQYVPAADVVEVTGEDGKTRYEYEGQEVQREYGKMGKSLKNSVTPDEMYEAYGADTFRVYEMSMGPLDISRPWETRAVVGAQRFLQRLWRNVVDEETGEITVSDEPADDQTRRLLHRTIKETTEEMREMRFNTALSKLIVLNNHATGLDRVPREVMEPLVLMTAPFAPHAAEELWRYLGHEESLAFETYPTFDEELAAAEKITAIVQIMGKVRAKLEVDPSINAQDLERLAFENETVQGYVEGKQVRKVIVREPKLVSIVLG